MKLIGDLKIENSFYELYQKDAEFFKILKWFEQSRIEEKKEEPISKSEIQLALINPSGKVSYYIEDEYDKEQSFTCSYSNNEKDKIEISIYGYGDTPEEALDNTEKKVSELLDKCIPL